MVEPTQPTQPPRPPRMPGRFGSAFNKPAPLPLPAREHWRLKRRLTRKLLAIWFVTTFISVYFARELDTLSIFGWPVSFYLAAQGMGLIYLALVCVYTRRMTVLEAQLKTALELAATPDTDPRHAG